MAPIWQTHRCPICGKTQQILQGGEGWCSQTSQGADHDPAQMVLEPQLQEAK
jgi:hypothetical protein